LPDSPKGWIAAGSFHFGRPGMPNDQMVGERLTAGVDDRRAFNPGLG
jgi:hypothetical protein